MRGTVPTRWRDNHQSEARYHRSCGVTSCDMTDTASHASDNTSHLSLYLMYTQNIRASGSCRQCTRDWTVSGPGAAITRCVQQSETLSHLPSSPRWPPRWRASAGTRATQLRILRRSLQAECVTTWILPSFKHWSSLIKCGDLDIMFRYHSKITIDLWH